MFIEVLTIGQTARELGNGKIGKGSKQQQREMTMLTGNDVNMCPPPP